MTSIKKTIMTKKGITPVQIVGVIIALVIIMGIALYVTTKKTEMLPVILAPEQPLERKPAIANIIAAYDTMYDSNEYCFDGEVYELRCEEACKPGGIVVQPKIAFIDCKSPKYCCQYAPVEWPSFDEEPRE